MRDGLSLQELDELDRLRDLDPDPDTWEPEASLPFGIKQYAGWSRPCRPGGAYPESYLEHLKCRGLSRRSCICFCHPENRAHREGPDGGVGLA